MLSGLPDVDGAGAGVAWIRFLLLIAITSGEMVGFPTLYGMGGGILCEFECAVTWSRWSRKAPGFSAKR